MKNTKLVLTALLTVLIVAGIATVLGAGVAALAGVAPRWGYLAVFVGALAMLIARAVRLDLKGRRR